MKKIISLMLVCMLITTSCFAGTFTKTSNGSSVSINVEQGKTILIKARDIFGKIFTGWTITGASVSDASQKEQTITMGSGNITAIANYATPYTVTVEQKANGVISPGTVTVAEGSSQTFTITPNTGHTISDVLVDGVSVKSSLVSGSGDTKTYTMNVNGNKTITALYNSDGSSSSSVTPSISVTSKSTSSIAVNMSATGVDGSSYTYKLYVDGTLAGTWTGKQSGSSQSYTASNLTDYTSYSFYFEVLENNAVVGSTSISARTKCYGGTSSSAWTTCDGRIIDLADCGANQVSFVTCSVHGKALTITKRFVVGSYYVWDVTSAHCIHGYTSTHD